MPANKKNNKKAAAKPEKEEDIDAVLAEFAAKRCDQLLEETDLSEIGKPIQPAATTVSTKRDRRNKRKEWEKNGKPVPLDPMSQHILDSTIPEPDHPIPPLTWDPLALSGPHSSIGAGAAAQQVRLAAVALD